MRALFMVMFARGLAGMLFLAFPKVWLSCFLSESFEIDAWNIHAGRLSKSGQGSGGRQRDIGMMDAAWLECGHPWDR